MIALGLLLVAGPSPIALDGHFMMGARWADSRGEVPSFISGRASQKSTWFHLRGGFSNQRRSTFLGSNMGFEYALRFGITPSEVAQIKRVPLAADGQLAFALRTYSFERPFPGVLVGRLGVELGQGGGYWWSAGARFSPWLGARLMLGTENGGGLELEYGLHPRIYLKEPDALDIRRTEHRLAAFVTAKSWGLGVWFTEGRTRARLQDTLNFEAVRGWSLGVGLEWRPR